MKIQEIQIEENLFSTEKFWQICQGEVHQSIEELVHTSLEKVCNLEGFLINKEQLTNATRPAACGDNFCTGPWHFITATILLPNYIPSHFSYQMLTGKEL